MKDGLDIAFSGEEYQRYARLAEEMGTTLEQVGADLFAEWYAERTTGKTVYGGGNAEPMPAPPSA